MSSLCRAFALIALLIVPVAAHAEVSQPTIVSASFDSAGKLVVKSHQTAYAGCYLTVNGGLSASRINTAIISKQLSASEAARGSVTIKTSRRYYCRRRKLYVETELVCLGDEVAQYTSDPKAVTVPNANVR